MNPVRDDHATVACTVCRRSFVPEGRQRFCSTTCRQTAWRRLHAAPLAPLVVVAKASTVYECDSCGNRYLGTQRCEDCNTFARKVGPGGCCPYCDEPVALADIIDLDQMRPSGSRINPTQPRIQRVRSTGSTPQSSASLPGGSAQEASFWRVRPTLLAQSAGGSMGRQRQECGDSNDRPDA